MKELNSGPPKTNPSSGKEEDLNPGPPGDKSSALPLGHTRLEQRPEKNSGSERDSNPRPLRCQCSALPTELSKPHESGRMRVSPLNVALIAQLGEHCTGIGEVVGSNPAQSLNFFQVSVLVVLRPHLH